MLTLLNRGGGGGRGLHKISHNQHFLYAPLSAANEHSFIMQSNPLTNGLHFLVFAVRTGFLSSLVVT